MPTSRSEQTKRIAQRIDITYPRRPTWYRLWRRWTIVISLLIFGIWVTALAVGNLKQACYQRMLNPAPLTLAHANIESNCSACHDHGGKGGFSMAVSDTACLKCHDASPHGKGLVNQFVSTDGAHSASCLSCHTEHHGEAALAGTDSRLCTQCHENLGDHLMKGRAMEGGFNGHITAFAIGAHPAFGRSLVAAGIPLIAPATQKAAGDPWLPNLHLKFNHATHMDPQKVQTTLACATCHVTLRPDPKSLAISGSMQPVNYETNCRSCHKLQLEKSGIVVAVPHESLDIAKAPLLDLSGAVRDKLVASPAQLKAAMKEADDPIGKAVKEKTDALYDSFSDTISAAYGKEAKRVKAELKIKANDDRADQLDAAGDLAAKDRTAVAEFLAANKATTSCSKCHEMSGDLEMIYALKVQWNTLKPPATGTPPPQRLHTVATGIGLMPKRWFAASRFDHEAHRDQSCLSCHVGMDKDNDDGFARLPAMESCVACHHADNSLSRGAGTACIECHSYHPR